MLELTLDISAMERARELLVKFPEQLRQALLRANVQSSGHVLNRIKQVKLVGGNPLGAYRHSKRTGNLARSWSVIPPVGDGDGWRGGVGSNSNYAAAHEFGVDITQNVMVRAYTRKQDSRSTYRKSAANYRRGGTGVVLASQGVAFVRSFMRWQHTKLPARPYARPSFTETAERIRATHHDQIRQAWEKSK